MNPDTLIAHPTPEEGLWLVATPDGPGTVRPVLIITRDPEGDGLWHLGPDGEHGEGFSDIRNAFAEAVRQITGRDERPPVHRSVCPACSEQVEMPSEHGFVWHASKNKVIAPTTSIFAAVEAHVASCPMQVADIAYGWLQACGWLVDTEEGRDLRDGPFTDDLRNLALQDVQTFLQAADTDDVRTYLAAAEPVVTEEFTTHEMLGHDLYLTQHHHGSGFWERIWLDDDLGDRLSAVATTTLRERYAWVTEDGEVDAE